MARFNLSVVIATLLCLQCGTAAAIEEELPADIVTGLLPITTYLIANSKDDDEGKKQFWRSNLISLVVNTTLRGALNKSSWGTRPNGHPYGFPSGHAAFVTTSAAFLQDRYGWQYGVPAYLVVGYVTYVRVDTGHHRWRDVIAGTALSVVVSKFVVTPYKTTHITPIIGPDTLGLRWESSF